MKVASTRYGCQRILFVSNSIELFSRSCICISVSKEFSLQTQCVVFVSKPQPCALQSRGPYIIAAQLAAVVIMFLLNGLVTVPLYSICAITVRSYMTTSRTIRV